MERIAHRHRERGDDDPALYSNDSLEVLRYLRKCPTSKLLGDETGHDIEDALVLLVGLWWELQGIELSLLDAAEELKLNRRRIGSVLGIKTGQGLVDRRDRKRAMLGDAGVPDEKIARSARRAARHAASLDVESVRTLRAFVELLLDHREQLSEAIAEELPFLEPELNPPYPDAPLSPVFLARLRLLVRDLRVDGEIAKALPYVVPILNSTHPPVRPKKRVQT